MTRVVHFQIGAFDPRRLARFYEEVAGWTFLDARLTSAEANRTGAYRFVSADEAGLSGGVTSRGPKGLVLTMEVDDIVQTLARADRLGGRPLADVAPEELRLQGAGNADGTFVIRGFVDPEGNHVQVVGR